MGRKWKCTKNIPKMQHIWYLGMPTGSYCPMSSYIFRKLFSRTNFLSQMVYLYLEPFMGRERGGKESGRKGGGYGGPGGAGNGNAQKISPKCNIFGIWVCPLGATASCHHTFLESSFQGQNFCQRWYTSILNRLEVIELQT